MSISEMEAEIRRLMIENTNLRMTAGSAPSTGPSTVVAETITQLRTDLAAANDKVADISNNYAKLQEDCESRVLAIKNELADRASVEADLRTQISDLETKLSAAKALTPPLSSP